MLFHSDPNMAKVLLLSSNFTDSILNSMEYKQNKKPGKQLFNDKRLNVAEFYYYIKKP